MIDFKRSDDDRHYFNLRANNNEIVSTSQMYDRKDTARAGADAVFKATGEYWALAFATIIEERELRTPEAIVETLMTLRNDELQEILDRIPYETNK